jgi:hypothetical protein
MVKQMSRKEIEDAMIFENEVQKDVDYIPTWEETGEDNWEEYLRKQQEEEQEYDDLDMDYLDLDMDYLDLEMDYLDLDDDDDDDDCCDPYWSDGHYNDYWDDDDF